MGNWLTNLFGLGKKNNENNKEVLSAPVETPAEANEVNLSGETPATPVEETPTEEAPAEEVSAEDELN